MTAASKLLLIFAKQDSQLYHLNHPGLPITDSCPIIATGRKNFLLDGHLLLRVSSEIQSKPAAYADYVFHMSFQDDAKEFLYVILQKGVVDTAAAELAFDRGVPDHIVSDHVVSDHVAPDQTDQADQSRVDGGHRSFGGWGWDEASFGPACADPVKREAHEDASVCLACGHRDNVWEGCNCPHAIKENPHGARTHRPEGYGEGDAYSHSHPLPPSEATLAHARPNPLVKPKQAHRSKEQDLYDAKSWNTGPNPEVAGWSAVSDNSMWDPHYSRVSRTSSQHRRIECTTTKGASIYDDDKNEDWGHRQCCNWSADHEDIHDTSKTSTPVIITPRSTEAGTTNDLYDTAAPGDIDDSEANGATVGDGHVDAPDWSGEKSDLNH